MNIHFTNIRNSPIYPLDRMGITPFRIPLSVRLLNFRSVSSVTPNESPLSLYAIAHREVVS
jgi:hypothetical protein